jgi:uncharacterized protein (TIGR03083 family)
MSRPLVDTRFLFRPLTRSIVALERQLTPADWARPTLAGRWVVREVATHLLDTALRRLSFQRDRHQPPPPPVVSDDLTALINALNADWVEASARLSPRVITDLYAWVSSDLSDFFESLPIDAPALFPVSWAGDASDGWLDTGREFTEIWHHGSQIREAVGAGPFPDPAWLRAVLLVSMTALPHSYRDVPARPGQTVAIIVTGPAGGRWVLCRGDERWRIDEGEEPNPDARVTMSDETAWRLLFNALSRSDATPPQIEGELARPLLRARSVIV